MSFFFVGTKETIRYIQVSDTEQVSTEHGSSVLLCKKIIVHLKEKCKLEKYI